MAVKEICKIKKIYISAGPGR